MFPDYWTSFLQDNDLKTAMVEIPAEIDLSGLGGDLQFLTPEQSLDEAINCWPGLGVTKDGYVSIGACLRGSGDYYYIRTSDGDAGPLYRIYHDAVDEDGYEPGDAIATVLGNFQDLLHYATAPRSQT